MAKSGLRDKSTRFSQPCYRSLLTEIDEKEFEKFFKTYLGISIYFSSIKSKNIGIKDRNINESAAMEAMLFVYGIMKKLNKDYCENEVLTRSLLKKFCNRSVIHQLIYFGLIRNRNVIYFPKKFISWEEYFSNYTSNSEKLIFYKGDLEGELQSKDFTEIEINIIKYFMEGYFQREIGAKISKSQAYVNKVMKGIFERFNI